MLQVLRRADPWGVTKTCADLWATSVRMWVNGLVHVLSYLQSTVSTLSVCRPQIHHTVVNIQVQGQDLLNGIMREGWQS